MSLANAVHSAIDKIEEHDAEGALSWISIALDATARNEYPNIEGRGQRFKTLIRDNIELITGAASNITVRGAVKLPNFFRDIPGLKTRDEVALEQVMWNVVRNELIHNAGLPETIEFIDTAIIDARNGVLGLPISFATAMLLVVIAAESNGNERSPAGRGISIRGREVPLNDLWGRRKQVRRLAGL